MPADPIPTGDPAPGTGDHGTLLHTLSAPGSTPDAEGTKLVAGLVCQADSPPGFCLQAEVGRGGMGLIFRAHDLTLDRDVAVKVLRPGCKPDGPTARRFREEAKVTAQLQHPGIPPVYHFGHLPDGRPFLAMKLIKGDTLSVRLKRDGTGGRWVAEFEKVCEAVGYAHAHGVIHRDLKPSNVMVGTHGEVQVMDWGLAKVLGNPARDHPPDDDPDSTHDLATQLRSERLPDDATRAGEVLGTPAYMAPEQAIGAVDQMDPRTDVFGLGGVLCALLTGQPPFVGGDPEDSRQLAARGKLDDAFGRLDRCGADPALVALCKRCLSADKADRPAHGGEVAGAVAALRQAADARATQAALAAAAERVRRRLGAALAGVMVAAGVAAGVLWWRAAGALADAELAQGQTVTALRTLTDQALAEGAARQAELTAADRTFLQTVRAMWEGVAATRGRRADTLALRAEGNVRVGAVCRWLGELTEAEAALRAGIAAYDDLVRLTPDQPDHRLELARANVALGTVQVLAGHPIDAEAAFRAAADQCDRLAAARPGNPADRQVHGEADHGLGQALDAAGRTADAEAAYRAALDLRTRLAADFPDHPGYNRERFETTFYLCRLLRKAGKSADGRAVFAAALAAGRPPDPVPGASPAERHEQAVTLGGLAETLRDTGQWDKAVDVYRQTEAAHRALMKEFPARAYHRQELARTANGLANLLAGLGRTDEAEAAFRTALDMRERLLAGESANPARRRELADTYANLGNVLRDSGRLIAAEAAYRAGVVHREQVAADQPNRPEFRTELAGLLGNLGDLLRTLGRWGEAVGVYDRVVAAAGPVHAADPGRTDPRLYLRNAYWGRALALDQTGRAADALADWDRALALCEPDTRPACRAGRAVSLLRVGQAEKATAEAAELAAQPQLSGYAWYTLARFAAVAGRPDECVARLRTAVAAGWRNAAVTAVEPDFAPVRGRLDFRWLLAKLQARAKKTAGS